MPWLARGPRVFLHHELIVYIITHFLVSVRSAAAKQAGRPSNPLFPGVKSCHLRTCHFFVSLPCPTYWPILPGQVKYVPPATACPRGRRIDGTRSRGRWWSLTGSLHHSAWKRRGAMTINQYYFHASSRKRRGWFYFRNLALYRFPLSCYSKQAENRERNQFRSSFFFFFIKNYHLLSRRLTRTVGNVAATPQRRVIIIKPHRLMTANACFVVTRCHNSSQPRNRAILCYISSLTDPINRVVSAQSWLPHPVKWRHAQMGANFPLRPQSNMHSNPPSTIYQPFLTVGAGERSLILPGRSHP